MAAPTIADPGDHVYAQIITYRGVINTGNPWDITGGGVKATASTSVIVIGVTTSVPDTLIVQAVARDDDSSAAEFSAETNANLTGIAERSDAGTTSGNGGGFAVWDGVKATAGATGNTTATVTSSINAFLTIALKPQPPTVTSINLASANPAYAGNPVSWTVVFSTSVTGVDVTDFVLVPGGGVSGASITSVTGSGTTWTVTANSGTSAGTLGLNLVDDDSIVSAGGTPLGGAGAGNGNFTGQVYAISPPFCTAPSNVPAGVTVSCVCDQFGRASLNPSTIFGGNWIVSTSDTTGILPSIVNSGYLRLTNNTGNNAKAATVPGIFPAAGNYISVEFQHYAYNGSNPGADGIAVTLSDYSVPAVPGAFGGSLGYAQKNQASCGVTGGCPGFAGGWVGVALDEYGNYQNPTEGRILGPGAVAESVAVRGPGSGANGYRWMGGTGSSPGGLSIDNQASTTPAPGYMYQVIVDARNSSSGTINVSVNRDSTTKDGTSYTSLFGPFNAYTEANYALTQGWITQVVPNFWQISFTGSTGGSTNIHEIGSMRICAQTVVPPSGGTASGFSAIDGAYPGAPTVPAYQNFQTGHIYMKLVGTPFNLWVAALTSNGISTAYSSVSSKYVSVKLVDNSSNICGPDSALTCNSSCTNAAAVEAGATQIATFPSGSSTGVASPSPTFTLNSAWMDLVAVMKECTTSACTAFTATTPACSADTFSVRPLSIASVTSSNATNTTTAGAPTFAAGSGNFALTATTTGVSGSPSNYTGQIQISPAPASPATGGGTLICTTSATCPAGTPANTFPAATSGTPSSTATSNTFTYSEVGAFQLPGYTADATCTVNGSPLTVAQCNLVTRGAYDNTWTTVDSISSKSDCVANSYSNVKNANGQYGCNFGLLPNAVVFGRFIPDHFDTITSGGMTCPTGLTCPTQFNGFVYSGEPFTTNVYARNASGITTVNYDGTLGSPSLAKQTTLSAQNAAGGTASSVGSITAGSNVPAASFRSGATFAPGTPATTTYTFTTTPAVPTNIYMRAQDTDGVTSLRGASSVEGGMMIVSGRVNVPNAYGSELLPLSLTATVQYYNAAGSWVTSTTDNVDTVTAANITRTNCQGMLLSGGVCSATLGIISSVVSAPSIPPPYGVFSINLGAPGLGNTGSEDLIVNAGGWPAWLPSTTGRATFGVYGGSGGRNNFIYQRENY